MSSRALRVLAFAPLYRPFVGGIEVLLENILPALRARGIDVAVVTESSSGLPEHEVMDGTRVYRLPLSAAIGSRNVTDPLKVIRALRGIMETERPDAIHMHSVAQAASFYVDRMTSQPGTWPTLLVTLHGALAEQDKLDMVRRILARAKAVSGVSLACLKAAHGLVADSVPLELIYNGIPATTLESRAWRQGQRVRLICVGRWHEQKGYDIAIRALSAALQAGFDGELSLVGGGDQEPNWRALAASLGIAERVHFLGRRQPDEVEREMASSHALVAPSRRREGFGLVVAEAARLGVPAIVANTGGLPEVVVDDVTGNVVPSDDPGAIAEALVKMFASEAKWRDFADAARQHVRERFGFDQCVEGYVKFYENHLGRVVHAV